MKPRQTLERYFEALRCGDFAALGDYLSPHVRRIGPYGDVVEGREEYVGFLARVVSSLPNYDLKIHRIDDIRDGGLWVRLSEWLDRRGQSVEHPEALAFEFDENGRIERVDIYLKRLPPNGKATTPEGV